MPHTLHGGMDRATAWGQQGSLGWDCNSQKFLLGRCPWQEMLVPFQAGTQSWDSFCPWNARSRDISQKRPLAKMGPVGTIKPQKLWSLCSCPAPNLFTPPALGRLHLGQPSPEWEFPGKLPGEQPQPSQGFSEQGEPARHF